MQRLTKKQSKKEKRDKQNELDREASKSRMLDALIKLQESPFNMWQKESGLARSYFNKLLRELLQEEKVININSEKKHPLYVVTKIPNTSVLQSLSLTFLYDMLEKVNLSKDRDKLVADFNRCLGSLIAYILKKYYFSDAEKILNGILPTIGSYLSYFPDNFDRSTQHWVQKQEPNVESAEWQIWRDIDSKNYVTTIQFPKILMETSPKNSESNQKSNLPCSGRCVCENASNGCMNRLLDEKRKMKSANNATTDMMVHKKREIVVNRETIDSSRFKDKWLKNRNSMS